MSDHEEMLGGYGLWEKQYPYQASVGIPLIAIGPSVREGEVTIEPAILLNLHATFLDYAEVKAEDVDSVFLRPVLNGETDDHRDMVFAGFRSWRMRFDDRYKLITGWDPVDPEAAIRRYTRPFPSAPTNHSE